MNSIINFLQKAGAIKGIPKNYPEKEIYFMASLYKNTLGPFKLFKKFIDFQELNGNEIIGFDGNKKVLAKKDEFILFPNEPTNLNNECFCIVKKRLP